MQFIKQAELARLKGISRQGIGDAIKKGLLVLIDGQIDLDAPSTQDYLSRNTRQARQKPSVPVEKKPAKKRRASRPKVEKLAEVVKLSRAPGKKRTDSGGRSPRRELPAAGSIAIEGLLRGDLDAVKVIEQIHQLRVRTDAQRQRLIVRELVARAFSKIVAVETGQFLQYANKLAPEIAGMIGANDPAIEAKIRERIETEAYDTLAHIQRITDELLASVADADILDDEEMGVVA